MSCGGCHTIIAVQKLAPSLQIIIDSSVPPQTKLAPLNTKIDLPELDADILKSLTPGSETYSSKSLKFPKPNSLDSIKSEKQIISRQNGMMDDADSRDASEKEFELLEKKCEQEVEEHGMVVKQITIIPENGDGSNKTSLDLSDSESSSSMGHSESTKDTDGVGSQEDDDNKDIEVPREIEEEALKKTENRVTKFFSSFKRKIIFTETTIVKTKSAGKFK